MKDRERAGEKRDIIQQFDVPPEVTDFDSFLAWFKGNVYSDLSYNNDQADGGAPVPGSAYNKENVLPNDVAQRLGVDPEEAEIKDVIDIPQSVLDKYGL